MLNLAEKKGYETCAYQPAKRLYFSLYDLPASEVAHKDAVDYLRDQLTSARGLTNELPGNMADIEEWVTQRAENVGEEYRKYLIARKAGASRRYFHNKSHALYFLKAVAPTKLVDGAWLYGLLSQWSDEEYRPFIKTYLEELGDGVADKNHVVLYKKLLATQGCEQWQNLEDRYYIQGAIQLCLAHEAEHFLPEVLGYNLGYEQLPLHLLITAFELNELGIDPYYFTLHITIDNAATGHGQKAIEGLKQLSPLIGDVEAFYSRVKDGYRLNDLGADTLSVIKSFNLGDEVVKILKEKSAAGKNMHSDYCRFSGRTVNEWLSDPDQIPDFLKTLIDKGWITKGEPAENSKFWRLIQGDHAEMFGVFSEYEQQLLRDWIELPAAEPVYADSSKAPVAARIPSFRAQQRASASLVSNSKAAENIPRINTARSVIRQHHDQEDSDFIAELRLFEQQLASISNKVNIMRTLIALMSPANHHTRVGLMATRVFGQLFN